MANIYYQASGSPATGSDGLSALIRGEFLLIQAAFDLVPQVSTTGLFQTTFNQHGNFTYDLPSAPGTLATTANVAAETARATAAESAEAIARAAADTAEITARNAAISGETAARTAADALLAPINAPRFSTGVTLWYTLPTLDHSDQAVSSTWVSNFLAASGYAPTGTSPVTSVAGRTGVVTLTHTDITDWAATLNAAIVTAVPPYLRGLLSGLTLSNDIGTPNTVVDIAPGSATDSVNATVITRASTITKSIAGSWSAGSGAGGMGTGLTATASTWYHVYIATISGNADAFFDTAFPPTHAPGGTTASRRIGSIYLGAGGTITPFLQSGDNFLWVQSATDLIAVTLTTANRTFYTLFVPSGVRVSANVRAQANNLTSIWAVDFTSPDCNDQVVATVSDLAGPITNVTSGRYTIRTNTASQIGIRSNQASTTLSLGTIGWFDPRGRD